MLEIKEETFKLKIFGEEVEIPYPSGDSVDSLNEKISESEHKGRELRLMREFFADLGIKEEVLKKLQLPHYNQIFSALMPKKN